MQPAHEAQPCQARLPTLVLSVVVSAQNGPEVNPAGGQSTGNFENPGLTGGLRGRKRDATEGGTREIGLIEYPPAVKANRVEKQFPVITMDVMATVLDVLGMDSFEGRPLDGMSLLPILRGAWHNRSVLLLCAQALLATDCSDEASGVDWGHGLALSTLSVATVLTLWLMGRGDHGASDRARRWHPRLVPLRRHQPSVRQGRPELPQPLPLPGQQHLRHAR